MNKLTPKKVKEYVEERSNQEIKHCPKALAAACNAIALKHNRNSALDLLKLVCFNDSIPGMFTHSYGFHTATGRHIIETLKEKYYEYERS